MRVSRLLVQVVNPSRPHPPSELFAKSQQPEDAVLTPSRRTKKNSNVARTMTKAELANTGSYSMPKMAWTGVTNSLKMITVE
jgi:hypothetical protein